MPAQGRKVAVVGMGGAFPACSGLQDFNDRLFSNQSLIREWDKAVTYQKQLRSVVSGYISDEEMDLEVEIGRAHV